MRKGGKRGVSFRKRGDDPQLSVDRHQYNWPYLVSLVLSPSLVKPRIKPPKLVDVLLVVVRHFDVHFLVLR